MKILIITVAGCSTRFSKSIGYETLKCIYYKIDYKESLLFKLIQQPVEFDKYIIVGGYKYDELCMAVEEWFPEYADRIVLVKNPYFAEYGSGYSLYYGIQEAQNYKFDEIIFAEGDLFVDSDSFKQIFEAKTDVITCNKDPIHANKAVTYYFDLNLKIHYLYDTGHNFFEIKEPFISIYNSGQIWKMINRDRICSVCRNMKISEWKGTNLVFIEKYFNEMKSSEYEVIQFKNWINCNTVDDFSII